MAGVVLAHSLGGLRHDELAALVRADRAAAEQLPVLDRLLTPAFREGPAPSAGPGSCCPALAWRSSPAPPTPCTGKPRDLFNDALRKFLAEVYAG